MGIGSLRQIARSLSRETQIPRRPQLRPAMAATFSFHEAHPPAWIATRPATFQRFAAKYHTTTAQLADLARQAKPRLLVIYHYPNAPEEVFADMSTRYAGEFVVGRDLDVY